MKLDLLTNATVVDDAIRFVSSSQKSKENEKTKLSFDKEESNEHAKDEGQEEESEEITVNQVF
jgi:hypothetical protein